jgi:pyridoxine kinase
MSWQEAREMLAALHDLGCRSVLVTSARVDGQSCVIGYNHQDGDYFRLDYDEIPVLIHGTGVIFSAVLIGHLLRGEPLVDSTRTATDTYGVMGIPQIMLIGSDGTILARDLRGNAIEEAVAKALGK